MELAFKCRKVSRVTTRPKKFSNDRRNGECTSATAYAAGDPAGRGSAGGSRIVGFSAAMRHRVAAASVASWLAAALLASCPIRLPAETGIGVRPAWPAHDCRVSGPGRLASTPAQARPRPSVTRRRFRGRMTGVPGQPDGRGGIRISENPPLCRIGSRPRGAERDRVALALLRRRPMACYAPGANRACVGTVRRRVFTVMPGAGPPLF